MLETGGWAEKGWKGAARGREDKEVETGEVAFGP